MRIDRHLDVVALAIYNAHWDPAKREGGPPIWQDLSPATQVWFYASAKAAIDAHELWVKDEMSLDQAVEIEHGPVERRRHAV